MNNIYDLGKAGFVVRGQYSSSSTYERLDVVTYDNEIYSAIIDVPRGIVPGTIEAANYWYKMMAKTPVQQQVLDDIENITNNITNINGDITDIKGNITNLTSDVNELNNIVSRMLVYANTDVSYISSHKIVGVKIPTNIGWGKKTFEFLVVIPCNCRGLAIGQYTNNTTESSSNVIVPKDLESNKRVNWFMQDDIWRIVLGDNGNNTVDYRCELVSREKKVVSTQSLFEATTFSLVQNGPRYNRFTIHPASSIGSLKKNITYVFNCINNKDSFNFGNYCRFKNDDNFEAIGNFAGSSNQKKMFIGNKPVNGVGDYIGFQINPNINGDLFEVNGAENINRYDYDKLENDSHASFGLGNLSFNGPIPIRFPQLAYTGTSMTVSDPIYFNGIHKFSILNKLYVPKNTQFTIVLIPRFNEDGTINELIDDQGNKFYWNIFIYFDEIEKIIYYSSVYPDQLDISGDGQFDVTDISLAIDIVLGNESFNENIDLDNNGIIDVSDINGLIDVLLGRSPVSTRLTEYPVVATKTSEVFKLGNITLNNRKSVAEANAMAKLYKDHIAKYKNYDSSEITFDYSDMLDEYYRIISSNSRKIVTNFWLNNRTDNETFEDFATDYLNNNIISSDSDGYTFVKNLLLVIADIYKQGYISAEDVLDSIQYINDYPAISGQSLEIYEPVVYNVSTVVKESFTGIINVSPISNYLDSAVEGGSNEIQQSIINEINGNP